MIPSKETLCVCSSVQLLKTKAINQTRLQILRLMSALFTDYICRTTQSLTTCCLHCLLTVETSTPRLLDEVQSYDTTELTEALKQLDEDEQYLYKSSTLLLSYPHLWRKYVRKIYTILLMP